MAVYYKGLVNIPRHTLSIQIKNLKSSFERRLYIFLSFSAQYFDVID